MTQRYFVESAIRDSTARLVGPEAHHLLHVMRAKAGDEVTLFDGSGVEFAARVERCGRSDVELSVVSRAEIDRELPRELVLGVALPKGERQKWLVEKAVEVGVSRLAPLVTQRGVAQPAGSTIEKLKRAVIEASKQCGRNRLMQIAEPVTWSEFLTAAPPGASRLFAHPETNRMDLALAPAGPVFAAIGPEGGFTDEEVAAARGAGWRAVDLGPRILRVETAALWLTARVVSSF